MIIDFTVENFRSIKEPVTLSLVAQSRAKGGSPTRAGVKADDEIARPYLIPERGLKLLPVAGIFGPNASGKSNVIRALDQILVLMRFGSEDRAKAISYGFVPFKLDPHASTLPTTFTIRLQLDSTIFTYQLSIREGFILSERLEHMPRGKRKSLLYERVFSQSRKSVTWRNGQDFDGPHTQLQNTIRNYEPFIALIANRLDVSSITPLSNWLRRWWPGIGIGLNEYDYEIATQIGYEIPEIQELVSKQLRQFDTGLAEVQIRKKDGGVDDSDNYSVVASHETQYGRVEWSLKEESTGTQHLFSLLYRIMYATISGTSIILDEIELSNIHPSITHAIVRMFQDEKTNPKRAQLIFNSHDYTLMHGNLMRRDQIWFTQKRKDGSTELYPLTDFHPRNDLAIDKAYIDGRFGAVPILPADEDLLPTEEFVG